MKKLTLAAAATLVLCSGAAFAGQHVTVSASSDSAASISNSWTSSSASDKTSVTNNGVGQLIVNITTYKTVPLGQGNLDGINVSCNGSITHINAGSGFRCTVTGNNTVSWSDDGSSSNGAQGQYSY